MHQQTRFLPAVYGEQDRIAGMGSLSAKILTSYIHMESITPAGRHAADQLLLRQRYLIFEGSVSELSSPSRRAPSVSDYSLDFDLMKAVESIVVEKRTLGARPRKDIFTRPILRSRAPKRGDHGTPWDNQSAVRQFPSGKYTILVILISIYTTA